MDAPAPGQLPVPPKPTAPRPRVLAVDDQPDFLRLLQFRLHAAGMDCIACSDGPAALKTLATQPVDLVILDVMMPHMDGFEVCRRIKANERTRDIPVVFLTARREPGDRIRGLQVGGHDYLSKPIEQQELLARTRAALRVKQLQDQLKEQLHLQQQINELHQEKLSQHWQIVLGQLASSLAHEINNPLAAALGGAQLLGLEKALSPEGRQRAQVIDECLVRAGKKLRSLLLIAQTTREQQAISLDELVEDLMTLCNFQSVVSKVTITSQVEPGGQWLGVPSELARAALYMINNAIEATAGRPNAGVNLRVFADENWQYLCVQDNGPGIPESLRAQLFQPFVTTKGPPHHGVGLYLSSELVKSAGGHVHFQSPSGNASTEFIIGMPRSISSIGNEGSKDYK
jgi:signal transduction histidine kinase